MATVYLPNATALINNKKGPPSGMAGLFENDRKVSTAATAAAVATAAAAFVFEIFRGRDAAVLDGAADVFGDFLLEAFQLALGGEEIAGDFIGKQGVAG